jgi:hypothetical protein
VFAEPTYGLPVIHELARISLLYEVVAPMGAGGMAEVYQAHDTIDLVNFKSRETKRNYFVTYREECVISLYGIGNRAK